MNRVEKPEEKPEGQARRNRLSRMSEASIRINESLDFDMGLQEMVDSARTLTGSRYRAMDVLDEAWHRPDFIVSGLTRKEEQGLRNMPQGLALQRPTPGTTSTTPGLPDARA